MATCVTLNADGTLTPTGQPVSECSGYVLQSGSEAATTNLVEQLVTLPTAEQVAQVWGVCFFLPLICYVLGHFVGVIVNMFRSH